VQSISHAQQVARQATGRRRVHFAPHPLLSPVLPLWGSADLYSKRRLRTLVAKTSSRRAQAEQAARTLRASELSPAFAAALESIDWAEVFNLPDSSSRQRLLFLKIKGLRLSGWDLSNGRRGCPHCADSGAAGGSTLHIVWDCPSARHLWATVRCTGALARGRPRCRPRLPLRGFQPSFAVHAAQGVGHGLSLPVSSYRRGSGGAFSHPPGCMATARAGDIRRDYRVAA
jgi:hypothetical protein